MWTGLAHFVGDYLDDFYAYKLSRSLGPSERWGKEITFKGTEM